MTCVKQNVLVVIENNGKFWTGTNWCRKPQKICPRGNMPSEVGYALCKKVCKQNSHAEIEAIKKAGKEARGGTAYIFGHTYSCKKCIKAMKKAGIEKILIVAKLGDTTYEICQSL